MYEKELLAIEAGLSARTSVIAQATGEQAALQAAKDIITNGYQSDVNAISAAVSSQVGAIQTQNTTLTAQIAQIQTILADGSGSDNQIQEIITLLAPQS